MTNVDRLKASITIAAFVFGAVVLAGVHSAAQKKVETAGERFKNIKVLNDVPADDIGPMMNLMSASLGVDCKFCHTSNNGDFEKDLHEHKDIAREMIKMTFAINKQFFDGKTEVTCSTCHNGRPMPSATPDLLAPPRTPRVAQPAKMPTLDEILKAYENAMGGRERLSAIRSMEIEALRLEPDGKTAEPEKVYFSPGKLRVETLYGNYLVVEAFDGERAWKTGGGSAIELKKFEAQQIEREARLFANADIKSVYTKLEVKRIERINGREVTHVVATPPDGDGEHLYFDRSSGSLVRRVASRTTEIGEFQFQVDMSDHKRYNGIMLPGVTRFSMPSIAWTRKIVSIRTNSTAVIDKFKQ